MLCRQLSDLFGRVSVDFLEHPAEKLIVGQPVFVEKFHDRLITCHKVMIKMRDPHTVHMLGECDSERAVEQTAEILPAEAELPGNLLQRNAVLIVLVYILKDLLDALQAQITGK